MKICIVASDGGHLTEVMMLKNIFEEYDFFVISYPSIRVNAFAFKKYLVPRFTRNLFKLLSVFWLVLVAFIRERPRIVISTGSEIAIPVFLVAKLFRAKTVFIETMTAIEKATLTGRILYGFSDKFFVQNQESLEAYGPRAEFHGGLL